MGRMGKKYRAALAQIEPGRLYTLADAVPLIKRMAYARFDETVEVTMVLGVDPRKADQMVRGTVILPNGLGKTKRVVVIAAGEKQSEARTAGADEVGGEDFVERIKGGWLDFDVLIATPDMMKSVGALGKILGPRGLMPNPKTGTVTFEVGKAVQEVKAGKVEFRVDKTGVVHVPVGRVSFSDEKLTENIRTLIEAVLRAKPSASKGRYVRAAYCGSTMGPAVPLASSEYHS